MLFDKNLYQDKIALLHEDGELTYKNVFDFQDQLEMQITHRELAFLMCTNTWECIALYVNLVNMKIPVVLLRGDADISSLESYVEIYKPKYIFSKKNYFELCLNQIGALGRYKILKTDFIDFNREIDSSIAILIPTSGSTGSPQLVMLSEKNLSSNAKSIITGLNMSQNERAITSLPMNYAFGLSIINTHLMVGASIAVTDKSINERDFWNCIIENNVTTIAGVPYTFNTLSRLRSERYIELGVKKILQAGGKLNNGFVQTMYDISREAGISFFVMYGQTEATARITILSNMDQASNQGSVGKAIPGVKLWIQDNEGRVVNDPDIEGSIWVSGENVFLGYATSSQDLLDIEAEIRVLETGDIGYLNSDGFLFISGRKRRFTKAAGIRINLDDVDLFASGQGYTTASLSLDDQLFVAVEGMQKHEDLQTRLAAHLQIHRELVSIYPIQEIPRSEAGKILYPELEHQIRLTSGLL